MRKNTKEQSQRHAKLKKQEIVRAKKRELRKNSLNHEQLNLAVDFAFSSLEKINEEADKVKWINVIYTLLHKKYAEIVTPKHVRDYNLKHPDMQMTQEEQIKLLIKAEFDNRKAINHETVTQPEN